jgi:hypothetical protein|tara:strand:+ start:229 stop:465 length:237 start_codon:yes stop_codon:yes gene_type:complete
MFTSANFKDSLERCVAAFVQTLVALVGTDGAGMLEVGLTDSVKASAAAAVLSALKSFAAIKGPIGGANPSMVDLDQQP